MSFKDKQKEKDWIVKYYKDRYKEEDKNFKVLKERILKQNKIYLKSPIAKERIKIYFSKKKKKIKEQGKKYRLKNKDKINKYRSRRYSEDNDFRISCLLRIRVHKALKLYTKTGKICSSKKYGINYQAIIEHLKPFPENLLDYHLHHIKPLFTFNFTNKDGSKNLEEIKNAFAPENHKLLLIDEHRKLNNKRGP